MLSSLVNKMIPPSLRLDPSTEEFRKARLFYYSIIIAISYPISYTPIYVYFGYQWGAISLVFTALSLIIAGVYFRYTSNFIVAGNLFSVIAYVAMASLILTNGSGSGVLWWLVAPISSYLYANQRSGNIWAVISGITISLYYAGKMMGYEYWMLYDSQYYFINEYTTAFGLFIYVVAIILVYESEKNALISRLLNSVDEINTQNEEIRQQQEEILAINDSLEGKNHELKKVSEKIFLQNTKILDSLRYAQTIQQALLPSIERLKRSFPESFVIYRPKDIVSGDFYWLEEDKSEGYTMVAVGDCTGHGVPGAFMSIISISTLNDLILKKGLSQPSEILEETNHLIRDQLKQDSSDNMDGLDLSFCAIKQQGQRFHVKFSGAKQSLYVLEPSQNKLRRIKGNRKTIGGRMQRKSKAFTQEEFWVESGTTLYLFSDGYSDQNNNKNEKFGTKRLLELTEENHGLPIDEQEQVFEKVLEQYQMKVEQRDDITLMALKLNAQ